MARVLQFIAWAARQVWRYGYSTIQRAISWARNNWRTVLRWLEAGVSYGTILEWILNYYI